MLGLLLPAPPCHQSNRIATRRCLGFDWLGSPYNRIYLVAWWRSPQRRKSVRLFVAWNSRGLVTRPLRSRCGRHEVSWIGFQLMSRIGVLVEESCQGRMLPQKTLVSQPTKDCPPTVARRRGHSV